MASVGRPGYTARAPMIHAHTITTDDSPTPTAAFADEVTLR
ncbi:hypothetical protein [Halarchaeum sp. CBA1220]|nr:hypothetical protein [Halarchaeum sp. CBA1220]